MSSVAINTALTPDDLLAMPDGDRYELVNGELVECDMAFASGLVAGEMLRQLGNFCADTHLGSVSSSDTGYQCFPDDPMKIRKPDVSVVRKGRLPADQVLEGYVRIAPDLAVEVVSPNDLFFEVEAKVAEYLDANVPLIWVVNPQIRMIAVHRADGSVTKLRDTDELSGENILPGFRCTVKDIFQPLDDIETTT